MSLAAFTGALWLRVVGDKHKLNTNCGITESLGLEKTSEITESTPTVPTKPRLSLSPFLLPENHTCVGCSAAICDPHGSVLLTNNYSCVCKFINTLGDSHAG